MRTLLAFSFSILMGNAISAQNSESCPPSETKGIHVVQKGETLYSISKKYKVSMDNIAEINDLKSEILRPCMNLKLYRTTASSAKKVKAAKETPADIGFTSKKEVVATARRTQKETAPMTNSMANTQKEDIPKSYNTVTKAQMTAAGTSLFVYQPSAKTHVIKAGETLSSISETYGYTIKRMMAMNNIVAGQTLYVGQELSVNDSPCLENTENMPPQNTEIAPTETTEKTSPEANFDETLNPNVPQSYNYAPSQPSNQAGNPNLAYFKTSDFTPFYHIVTNSNGKGETPEFIGNLYGLSAQDVMMMNNLNSSAPLSIGQKLMLEDRNKPRNTNYILPTNTENSSNIQPNTEGVKQPTSSSPKPPSSTKNMTNMTSEEMQMVDEINLVRSNPAGYIPYIQAYINDQKANGGMGNPEASANELIQELRNMPKLNTLQTTQCIYEAARKHGQDQIKMGSADHTGSDGSHSWDRVKRECPQLKDGNENLVGGPSDIRKAVITLLVDDGIESRGHRRTMLQNDWQYVACYKVGTVGGMPNCWVQNFGN